MKHLKFIPILSIIGFSLLFTNTSHARRRRRNRNPIRAKSWIVASLDGKKIYLSRKPDQVRAIASLSKLMATAVVVNSGLNLKAKTTMLQYDWDIARGGCRTRLRRKKAYTNYNLLHAALLGSDNRSIPALGRAVGMNADVLVRAMNAYARKLGLRHTHFKDPTGISHDNVSTARELLKILRVVSRNKVISSISRKPSYVVYEEKTRRKIIYNNTNILTRRSKYGIIIGKTGFNDKAGYCLATVINDKKLGKVAFVILGSTGMLQRFSDFHKLYRKLKRMRISKNSLRYVKNTKKHRIRKKRSGRRIAGKHGKLRKHKRIRRRKLVTLRKRRKKLHRKTSYKRRKKSHRG